MGLYQLSALYWIFKKSQLKSRWCKNEIRIKKDHKFSRKAKLTWNLQQKGNS